MIRAHQPGSQPIDIPEVIPNPAVVPKQEPAPKEPAPKNPVKEPEKVPAGEAAAFHTHGPEAQDDLPADGDQGRSDRESEAACADRPTSESHRDRRRRIGCQCRYDSWPDNR